MPLLPGKGRNAMTNADFSEQLPFSISVVVPVYNGAATLVELVQRIDRVLTPLVPSLEIILVNDGSHDRSWPAINQLARADSRVRGLNLMRNYGQHNALLAGIQQAQHLVIVTMDDDLQHPPEEVPKLLVKLEEGYDIVYGKPIHRSHDVRRNISSRLLKIILRVAMGAEIGTHSSAFRAFRSVLRGGFENFTGAYLSIDVLLSWSAARVTHVLVEHHPRREGRSGYTFSKLMLLAFSILTGYSTLPLRIASGLGLASSSVGLVMFAYVVIRRLVQTTYVPGFAFLASEIALFAGLQLFAIGVIGEYVAGLHFRTMGKPAYVIREQTDQEILTASEVANE
jgi:glycosyltransferase involved in cell wall biosynthesis